MQILKNVLNQAIPHSFNQNMPSSLAQMQRQASALHKINQLWLSNLPENLRAHSMASQLTNGLLTVTATQNAVAAKIKLLSPSLLIQLKNQGLEVTAIQVKVQVISALKPQKIKPRRQLSLQTAQQLEAFAKTMQGSDLAESLQRLADHSKKD